MSSPPWPLPDFVTWRDLIVYAAGCFIASVTCAVRHRKHEKEAS